MKRLTQFLLIISVFALSGMLFANTPPSVTDVSASQRTDGSKIVDIWYSVNDADNDTLTVSLAVSNDNGATFGITPSPANLSGAIGENILSGTSKHIIWYAGAEGISFNGNQFRIKVTATEKLNLSYGLVAYYPFNGNADDESGNNRHGVLVSSPGFSADRFGVSGKAVRFHTNTDEHVSIPYYYYGLNPISISVWFKSIEIPDYPFIALTSLFDATTGVDYRIFQTDSSIGVAQHNPGVTWNSTSLFPISLSSWYHIVATYSDHYLSLYINGEFYNRVHCSNPSITSGLSTEYNIGTMFGVHDPEIYSIGGDVDDVRFYNRVVTNSDIQALYHEGGWNGN